MRTPPPYSDESLAGYLLRLAERNYYPSPLWLLHLAGLKGRVRLYFPVNLDQSSLLSQLIKIKESQLRAMAYGAFFQSYDRELLIYPLTHCGRKLCPLCLSESVYCRRLWDCKLINTCPFHQCLLVAQCPQCHQPIPWSRGGVTQCQCGFDFRSYIPKTASSYQVNLALYLFAIEGDTLCRTRLEKIYGANNPIFELNLRQFSGFSRFLGDYLPRYLQECCRVKSIRCSEYNSHLQSLSSEELVCYLFPKWRYNFKRIFDWYDHRLTEAEWEHNVLQSMSDFLTRLIWCFSDNSTFNQYISRYLKVFLQRHGIRQVEILRVGGGSRISMEAELEKVDSLLAQVRSLLHFDVLNLARLIAYSQKQFWILPDEKTNSSRKVIFLNPYDYSFERAWD